MSDDRRCDQRKTAGINASPFGRGGARSVTERAPSHPTASGALPKGEPFSAEIGVVWVKRAFNRLFIRMFANFGRRAFLSADFVI